MADDNTIIEGTVKFRDGKKWKSRWCVMRKLSPVADCVHVQIYRDSKARWGGGACKASLSLQHYLGCETGFTLDKHSNTLALLCRDLVAILAFDTRERLIQWQVKVKLHLGEPRQYLVVVGAGGSKRLPAGPARLHLHEQRFALTAGVPPRLLGVWDLPHLRRYGVVEGRFCFEGGSLCGKGEGLHVLVTDQAKEITHDFNLASQGRLSPRKRPVKKNDGVESPKSHKAYRPDTRLSELNTIDQSLPPMDLRLYEDPCIGEEAGAISPYWPSAERTHFQDMGLADTASVNEIMEGTDTTPWGGNGNVTLERCMSCISKLGALSRSSTAALTPGAKHFNPAWTMEALHENYPEASTSQSCDTLPSEINKTEEICHCVSDRPPERPPKPTRLELNLNKKPPMPLPTQTCSCPHVTESKVIRIGPYENYDVPKLSSAEVDGEYYDTPKRLKECLNNELFKVTKSSTPNAVILKKPCGCLLKFGRRRKEPVVVDSDEIIPPANCPCQRVTDWANNWIRIPYCKKNVASSDNLVPNKENVKPSMSIQSDLYATIDLSRKTRRKTHPIDPDEQFRSVDSRAIEIDEGPLANYENLNFALSLEHYENAKDLLRKAGVTQSELQAISANLVPTSYTSVDAKGLCTKCGHPPAKEETENNQESATISTGDDYLLMAPKSLENNRVDPSKLQSSGYTPMSPIGGFAFNTLKHPARSPISKLLDEKSASNPTLCGPEDSRKMEKPGENKLEMRPSCLTNERLERIEYRKRSSSADSSRFLEDVKEFEGSVGSRGSTSSIETLRNIVVDGDRVATPCDCAADNKHSDADSSEASKGRGRGQSLVKRACSVPGKTGGNRDSSSSNDSGVSSCSLRPGGELAEFELPLTTAAARRHYRSARRSATCYHTSLPRRSKSTDPLRDLATLQRVRVPAKSSSAEAEVPVLSVKQLRGIIDTHSTSSGTSDMSDYIETLSICSSHSSTDTPVTMRVVRQTTSTLRPRSGKEYQNPRLTASYHHPHHYTNLPS